MDALTQGDIFAISCRSQSVDGVLGLEVMDHFTEPEIRRCLSEFRRALKPDGVIYCCCQPNGMHLAGAIGPIVKRWGSVDFAFFPDEISRLHSKVKRSY